jgi:hypothetical protein
MNEDAVDGYIVFALLLVLWNVQGPFSLFKLFSIKTNGISYNHDIFWMPICAPLF